MTTIFTGSLNADDSGNEGFSFRNIVAITGDAQGQIRVTFKAASAGNFHTDHCAVGIWTGTNQNTTATPVELTFSNGGHGFSVSNGATATSDWVNLAGFTSANKLLVVVDFNVTAGGGNESGNTSSTGNTNYYQAATASYNVAVANFVGTVVNDTIVSLIEVQAAPGGTEMKRPSILGPAQGPSRGLRAAQAFPPTIVASTFQPAWAQGSNLPVIGTGTY